MSPRNWTLTYFMCALLGVLIGYFATLMMKPSLIPAAFRLAGVHSPTTILFLGTDVVYEGKGRRKKVKSGSYKGRSDTIMVARLDPFKNSISVLSIPRDTKVHIPGHGRQKINAANALGGSELVVSTIEELLGIDIEHYLVLNLQGLRSLVDELGGIEVDVPKRMRYRDKAAGLKIDLKPGRHLLDGDDAIGFVRFRHDQLGDIGRVQRQEIFINAVMRKAARPEFIQSIPKLVQIAGEYSKSDLSTPELISYASFAKDVPRSNQVLMMLPGRFSDSGDWLVRHKEKSRIVSRFLGTSFISSDRSKLSMTIMNLSSDRKLSRRVYKDLKSKGYKKIRIKRSKKRRKSPLLVSRIIAQRGNPADASLVQSDLGDIGTLVNASVGDIESEVTLELGEDLIAKAEADW